MIEQIVWIVIPALAGLAIGYAIAISQKGSADYQKAKRRFEKFQKHVDKKLGLDLDDEEPT